MIPGRRRGWSDRRMARGVVLLQFGIALLSPLTVVAAEAVFDSAAKATNEFGLDLYRRVAHGDENVCLSPYSISCALAMTLSGADGVTRLEMARVLHLDPKTDADPSFGALQKSLEEMGARTERIAENSKKGGGPSEPIIIAIGNRLFPQSGYEFHQEFFARIRENYGAGPEPLDFTNHAGPATQEINQWVAKQTRDRIRDLIPQTLPAATRLVLANAIYLKAPWLSDFAESATQPEPFHVKGGASAKVATMRALKNLPYAKKDGFAIVALPYTGGDLQFVVFLPDRMDGLSALEKKLDAATLAECAKLQPVDVDLHLPKFKVEPGTIPLSGELQALGMKSAFDIPAGSANFDRMALRKPDQYLAVSEVFHKTFIAVDEKGTEAAAATAVAMMATAMVRRDTPPPPIEVRVDRPFLYAIQHVPSGTCLFIGRVADPR